MFFLIVVHDGFIIFVNVSCELYDLRFRDLRFQYFKSSLILQILKINTIQYYRQPLTKHLSTKKTILKNKDQQKTYVHNGDNKIEKKNSLIKLTIRANFLVLYILNIIIIIK